MSELDLVEKLELIPPRAAVQQQLDAHGSSRELSMGNIQNIEGHCSWCGASFESKAIKPHHMRRWCSKKCIETAIFFCYPQSPAHKMYRLIYIQNFACAGCGESYEDQIRQMILKKYNSYNSRRKYLKKESLPSAPMEKVTLHYLGANTGDDWHTDHIIPVHKGGKGIDPSNLQVLCVPCHRRKTAEERRVNL